MNYVDPTGHQAVATNEGSCEGCGGDGISGTIDSAQVQGCKAWLEQPQNAGDRNWINCESWTGLLAYQLFGTIDYVQEEYPETVDLAGILYLLGAGYEGLQSSGLNAADETGAIKVPNWKDATSQDLVRYAQNMGLKVEGGGKHLKVYDAAGKLVTAIPNSTKGNFTVKAIVEAIQKAGSK